VALFAGGAAVASGLALFFTAPAAPRPNAPKVDLRASLGRLDLEGRW
jgi:hypothetical protein